MLLSWNAHHFFLNWIVLFLVWIVIVDRVHTNTNTYNLPTRNLSSHSSLRCNYPRSRKKARRHLLFTSFTFRIIRLALRGTLYLRFIPEWHTVPSAVIRWSASFSPTNWCGAPILGPHRIDSEHLFDDGCGGLYVWYVCKYQIEWSIRAPLESRSMCVLYEHVGHGVQWYYVCCYSSYICICW